MQLHFILKETNRENGFYKVINTKIRLNYCLYLTASITVIVQNSMQCWYNKLKSTYDFELHWVVELHKCQKNAIQAESMDKACTYTDNIRSKRYAISEYHFHWTNSLTLGKVTSNDWSSLCIMWQIPTETKLVQHTTTNQILKQQN